MRLGRGDGKDLVTELFERLVDDLFAHEGAHHQLEHAVDFFLCAWRNISKGIVSLQRDEGRGE